MILIGSKRATPNEAAKLVIDYHLAKALESYRHPDIRTDRMHAQDRKDLRAQLRKRVASVRKYLGIAKVKAKF